MFAHSSPGRSLAAANLLLALVAGASGPARADQTYFHNGRHAMPDFIDVNAYEQAVAARDGEHPVAIIPPGANGYNTRGSSATPDFAPVNAYIARNSTPVDGNPGLLTSATHGRNATPDFIAVRIREAGHGSEGSTLLAQSETAIR